MIARAVFFFVVAPVVVCACPGPGGNVPVEGEGESIIGGGDGEGEGEGEDDCVDNDGDGFFNCVDARFPDRPAVADCDDRNDLVVPGGAEFDGNDDDDDCDGAVDEVDVCDCAAGASAVLGGIGLCDSTVLATETEGQLSQRGVFTDYFGVTPPSGDGCLAAISSGFVDTPSDLVFDPTVGGVATGEVVTGETEALSARRCTLNSAPFDPCPRGFHFDNAEGAGLQEVAVTSVDAAGNVEPLPLRMIAGGEPRPATETALLSPLPDQHTSETKFTLIGTAPPGAKVDITIDSTHLRAAAAGLTTSTVADAWGRFVYPAEKMLSLGQGAHHITALVDDGSGGQVPLEVDMVVDAAAGDTTPPASVALLHEGQSDPDALSGELFRSGVDPGTGDDVNDPAGVIAELVAPRNALGFEVRVLFVSVEWPEFVCDEFNDAFRLVVETAAVEGGRPTDIAHDGDNDPITVNSGFFELPRDWTIDLSALPQAAHLGAGLETCSPPLVAGCTLPDYCDDGSDVGYEGSGTGWLKMRAPVTPGEPVRLTFLTFDAADFALDSIAFIDGFRWLPVAPPIGAVKE